MFYSEQILSKKAPLGKIWLAAHWERKLSKTQALQTDIPTAVSQVKTPDAPLALRLSGQLLLGVVRIYSRKAKYLLEDCGEAITKIKIAFVPGMVDLPEDMAIANYNTITLPENLANVDLLLPDIPMDFQFQPEQLQLMAPEADITMPDDVDVGGRGAYEDFGLELEPSIERGREAPSMSGFAPSDTTLESMALDVSKRGDITLPEFRQEPEVFGGEDFGMEPYRPEEDIFEPHPHEQEQELEQPEAPGDFTIGDESVLFTTAQAPEPVAATPKAPTSKKRKLNLDGEIELPPATVKKQIDDYADLVHEQPSLPLTKRTFLDQNFEKEGPVALFSRPVLDDLPDELRQLLQGNLTAKGPAAPAPAAREPSYEPAEEPEHPRERPELAEPSILDETTKDISDFQDTTFGEPTFGFEPEGPDFPPSRGASVPPLDREEIALPPLRPSYEAEEPEQEQEPEEPEASIPTAVSGGLSKQTVKVMEILRRDFEENRREPLSTEELFRGKTRKAVASTFFEILVLRTRGFIGVQQEEPYQNIELTANESLFVA